MGLSEKERGRADWKCGAKKELPATQKFRWSRARWRQAAMEYLRDRGFWREQKFRSERKRRRRHKHL